MLAFISNIGPLQLLIVLVIVLLLFGSRLPSLARSLGQSILEFKKGIKEIEDQTDDESTQKKG
jgi:sec-independent protein translocase protein TatA